MFQRVAGARFVGSDWACMARLHVCILLQLNLFDWLVSAESDLLYIAGPVICLGYIRVSLSHSRRFLYKLELVISVQANSVIHILLNL